jgi:hypothetical protein
MSNFFTMLIWFTVAFVLIGVIFAARNMRVLHHRVTLLALIDYAVRCDIRAGRPWGWRLDRLGDVDYTRMVLQFWRPCDSFWRDWGFINPKASAISSFAYTGRGRDA